MKHLSWLMTLCFGTMACCSCTGESSARDSEKKDDAKGAVVDLDGVKSRAPAGWKQEDPSNRMRLTQFRLPKVEGDKYDTEVVIFQGIGGSAKANIDRWKTFFIPPEGKTIDDAAKVTEIKVGEATAPYLDVKGTYKYKERPFDPNAKEERRPDYRMLGVAYDGPKNAYHIRMVGPAKTVEHYKKGFDEWLKAFK